MELVAVPSPARDESVLKKQSAEMEGTKKRFRNRRRKMGEVGKKYDEDFEKNAVNLSYARLITYLQSNREKWPQTTIYLVHF